MSKLEWTIIGGGPHGTMLSHWLTSLGGVRHSNIRVLDEQSRPFASWHAVTKNTGMTYLRSGTRFHIDIPETSLEQYILERGYPLGNTDAYTPLGKDGALRQMYRPSLALFDDHCKHIVERYDLDIMRTVARATRISGKEGALRVETDGPAVETKRIMLALGPSTPMWPEWAKHLLSAGAPVYHVLSANFDIRKLRGRRVAVIGGGISAAQAAYELSHTSDVDLYSRSALRYAELDANPAWSNPGYAGFCKLHTLNGDDGERLVKKERNDGSLPWDVAEHVASLQKHEDYTVVRAQNGRKPEIELTFSAQWGGRFGDIMAPRTITPKRYDAVLLATGYDSCLAGKPLVHDAVRAFNLPLNSHDVPLVDNNLHWGSGIYAMGELGKLSLGPFAPNLIGARIASQRLVNQ